MSATAENPVNLNIVLDVPVSLTIELGGCQLPMREILQLNIGSVVQLDKPADAPVELSVNGKLIARGDHQHRQGVPGPASRLQDR